MADSSDLDRQIEQLKKCEIIKEAEVKALCAKAREILIEESNVQRIDSPVTVCTTRFYSLIHPFIIFFMLVDTDSTLAAAKMIRISGNYQ